MCQPVCVDFHFASLTLALGARGGATAVVAAAVGVADTVVDAVDLNGLNLDLACARAAHRGLQCHTNYFRGCLPVLRTAAKG